MNRWLAFSYYCDFLIVDYEKVNPNWVLTYEKVEKVVLTLLFLPILDCTELERADTINFEVFTWSPSEIIYCSVTYAKIFGDTVGVLGAKAPRKSKGYNCDLRKIIFSFKYVWVSWLAIIYEERISADNYILKVNNRNTRTR